PDNAETWMLLEAKAEGDESPAVRQIALQKLARGCSMLSKRQSQIFEWLKSRAQDDEDSQVRAIALVELVRGWKDEPGMFEFLRDRALSDFDNQKGSFPYNPRFTALEAIIEHYPDMLSKRPGVLALLRSLAVSDADEQVRALARLRLKSEEW
ncbi:MAG TPA: histidine kinase, partial [Microcoleaceae bacterium UBA10368]|nr:histidine kinase [Microcoleaceae cyanobacterium UBA10368]